MNEPAHSTNTLRDLTSLRAVAIDVDGVLLPDTFSPVLRRFIECYGGGTAYSAEVERHCFSRPRAEAAQWLIRTLDLDFGVEEAQRRYFSLRAEWLQEHPLRPSEGAEALLSRLERRGLTLSCYGGLPEAHFHTHLGDLTRYFDAYVCTDAFRPGLAEIVARTQRAPNEIAFIDDVATVAEEARRLQLPFIGMPSTPFQHDAMKEAGTRFVVDRLNGIDDDLLVKLDHDAAAGAVW